VWPVTDTIAQKQQSRAKQLAARPEEVIVHLSDCGEVGQDDALQLIDDLLEVIADRALNLRQLRRARAQHQT
jgi:hypothetical protein